MQLLKSHCTYKELKLGDYIGVADGVVESHCTYKELKRKISRLRA